MKDCNIYIPILFSFLYFSLYLIEDYKKITIFNIGDYIQSIASLQYCNKKKVVYVERDS